MLTVFHLQIRQQKQMLVASGATIRGHEHAARRDQSLALSQEFYQRTLALLEQQVANHAALVNAGTISKPVSDVVRTKDVSLPRFFW